MSKEEFVDYMANKEICELCYMWQFKGGCNSRCKENITKYLDSEVRE